MTRPARRRCTSTLRTSTTWCSRRPNASIASGESQAYTAEGLDEFDNSLGDVPEETTFTVAGTVTRQSDTPCPDAVCAPTIAGDYTVTGTDGEATGTAALHVDAGAVDHLVLSPATATIASGESQAYTAEGFDAADNSVGDVTADTTFTVTFTSPAGRGGPTPCPDATCAPTIVGDYTVTGTDGTATGTASLHVNVGALDHLVLSPATATITSGESQAYHAEGFDAADNSLGDVTADTTFTVTGQVVRTPSGSCPDAVCAPTRVGDYTVTGTDGVATGTASLHVNVGALDHLVLAPATATITTGQSQTYTAEGFDAAGNTRGDVAGATGFAVDGDNCAAAQCAPTAIGNHTVTGTNGAATGTAALHVNPVSVTSYPAFAWGSNSTGQLGDGTTTAAEDPGAGRAPPPSGSRQPRARTTPWRSRPTAPCGPGATTTGQLGDGTTTDRSDPVPGRHRHQLGLVAAGSGHTWRSRPTAPCGPGATTRSDSWATAPPPTVHPGPGGHRHRLGLGGRRRDAHGGAQDRRHPLGLGRQPRGELGNGTTTARSAPVQVGTAATGRRWRPASTTRSRSRPTAPCGHGAGTLRAGGRRHDHQPPQPGSGRHRHRLGVVGVGGTTVHSLAIKTNGTLWAWGFNRDGQVGNGTTTNQTSPVQVGTDTDWASAATGQWHSLAVKANGTMWAWGNNDSGQLGDTTTTSRSTPVPVAAGFTWVTPVAGYTHSVGLGVQAPPVCSRQAPGPAVTSC